MDKKMSSIICFHCTGLIKPLWYNMIRIVDIQEAPINIVGYNPNTKLRCKRCSRDLQFRDLYFDNEDEYNTFMRTALEKIASKVSREIYCCDNCSGYIIERHVYNVNKGEPRNLIDENKYGTYITSILEENYLPENTFDLISKLLVCQECGYGTTRYIHGNPNNNKFDKWDKVYLKSEVNEFWGWNIIKFANKFDISIHEYELEVFKKFLYQQPMLALLDETGEKLYKAIKQSMDRGNFVVLSKEEKLFRGRMRYKDEKSFLEHEMWNPPHGIANHGRYNSIGKSVLYCSNQKEAVPFELHPTNEQIIDIVTFEVNHEVKLFDMDEAFEDFEGFIATLNSESKLLKQEYLITNFVGSCCEAVGYDGIKYSGVGNAELGYDNYALFDNGKLKELLRVMSDTEPFSVRVSYENSRYREKSIDEMLRLII